MTHAALPVPFKLKSYEKRKLPQPLTKQCPVCLKKHMKMYGLNILLFVILRVFVFKFGCLHLK